VKASEEERFVTHGEPRLTLVTCYPFRYVGPAPRRFVVLAGVRSMSPEPPER
jgi:sortase (surface protein transpeptidase)